MTPVKVLVFGAGGQVGRSLAQCAPRDVASVFLDRRGCDLADTRRITQALDEHQPDAVINAAAYTSVDRAEQEPALVRRVNAQAPAAMAGWVARRSGAAGKTRLIHISTDFVFGGGKGEPYAPTDKPDPVNAYGRSKLEGEQRVMAAAPGQCTIVRASWVYSEHGDNFVKTMLRLMGERDEICVVNDQRGSPTYAAGLAGLIWKIAASDRRLDSIIHWSDEGVISRFDFAVAVKEEAQAAGLLSRPVTVRPVPTSDYPTAAARPACSALQCTDLEKPLGVVARPWRERLQSMLQTLGDA